jgi:hypothetical protein
MDALFFQDSGAFRLIVIQLTTSDISFPPMAHLDFSADFRRLGEKTAGSTNRRNCSPDLHL